MSLPSSLQSLSLPAIAAPMFLVSGTDLALACCRAGIVGSFPALNARTSEELDQWLTTMNAEAQGAPYAVNLIVHGSNPRLEPDLALCVQHQVPIVITSLGAATEVIAAVHGYGGLVFHDVANLRHAHKAAEAGVDGLIAVCAGAGGHAGTLNPLAFVGAIREFFAGTVILAGAVGRGDDVLAAQAMGADLAYLGTRFIASLESLAPTAYREMILAADAGDIVYTPAVSGVPANFLRASLEAAGLDTESTAEAKLKPIDSEIKAWKEVWSAGHGVAVIHDVPAVAELVQRLIAEYDAARKRVSE